MVLHTILCSLDLTLYYILGVFQFLGEHIKRSSFKVVLPPFGVCGTEPSQCGFSFKA